MGFSSSGPVKLPGADARYDQILGLNVQNYQNMLGAYSGAQANANSALSGIYGDYSALGGNINSLMKSAYDVGSQDIQTGANKTLAKIKSNAINSGLGNSTIQMALQNQAQALTGREYGRLADTVTQQAADRTTQIGMAGLQARQQGLGLQTGLSQSYMSNLAGYHFAAPNVPLYGQQSYSYLPDSNYGHGGGAGATSGSAAPGGAAGAVGAAGAMPFGSAGMGNSYGSAGLYSFPGYGYPGSYGASSPGQAGGGYDTPQFGTNPSDWSGSESWDQPDSAYGF